MKRLINKIKAWLKHRRVTRLIKESPAFFAYGDEVNIYLDGKKIGTTKPISIPRKPGPIPGDQLQIPGKGNVVVAPWSVSMKYTITVNQQVLAMQIQDAIDREEYEEAALIRDKINEYVRNSQH